MSNINELVQDLCPAGIEQKTLGQAGEFIRGSGLQKADLRDVGVPAVHYGQIHTFYGIYAIETRSFTDPAIAAKLRHARPGDLLIATTSEDDDAVAKATAWLGDTSVVLSGDAYIYRHELDPKYASYFFQSTSFQDQKRRFISGTKVRRISGASLAKIRIPVPPLEVQREIVRVLDKYTQLEAKLKAGLEAELDARRAQYEYYRTTFLTFGDNVKRRPLGEIAVIGTGNHDTKDAIPDGEFTFYARGREQLRLDSYDFEERAIITAGDGVGVGKVFHFADGKYALHQRAYRVVPGDEVDARFIYHYLLADFSRYLERISVHASVTSLRRPMFLKYPIPVPPLAEQQRIVATLDRFDALVNDISTGLSAELAARRKQYEHYRDHLLTFKELVA